MDTAVAVPLDGGDPLIRVLQVEDLIAYKLLAGKILDCADAETLLRLNAPVLDRLSLRARAASLGIASEVDELLSGEDGRT